MKEAAKSASVPFAWNVFADLFPPGERTGVMF